MRSSLYKSVTVLFLLSTCTLSSGYSQNGPKLQKSVKERLVKWENPFNDRAHMGRPKIDSVLLHEKEKTVAVYFSPELSFYPFREESNELLISSLEKVLGRKFRNYQVRALTGNYQTDQLIPNYYRKELATDESRIFAGAGGTKRLIEKEAHFSPANGLSANSIALWHSHGYYFEMNLDRWEFQRAKLFGTVEDISVMSYVVPYLAPMLENAGANVFLPRERDLQVHEVIVDNDKSDGSSEVVLQLNSIQTLDHGFLLSDTLFASENPFKKGTSLRGKGGYASFIPDIPEKGSYAVYVSYPVLNDNSSEIRYIVNHSGGETSYILNQTIGGNTWIYLGTFHFDRGLNRETGSVTVRGSGVGEDLIAVDAVRFGGGMGNVARKPSAEILKNQPSVSDGKISPAGGSASDAGNFSWKLSGMPRFMEAARYYLQYAGMPDTIVYSPNIYRNDYNDDYQSRGMWVNYLSAEPVISAAGKNTGGLGLPVDLSLAFHTDAGVTPGDSIIGTLAICSTGADNGKFPDGTARLAGRDLADIVQTQIVDDIRSLFNPGWTRRGLWDKPYAEARRPNVPSMLLELLSHQNLADFRYGLDPRFRFHVSRAVYKGILRFLAFNEKRTYVVQPLPVSHFAIELLHDKTIRLSWQPVPDKLEPSAIPEKYLVYTRIGDKGFDNGIPVYGTSTELVLESWDSIYSFRVTAVNEGGESFASEILSAGIKKDDPDPVLVVNGFDRICGPEWFDKAGMAGVAWWHDRGVPDHNDFITIGDQYDYDRNSQWLDDDSPGWGASWSDLAGKVIRGNTFDYPYLHGRAIMSAGRSFISMSDEYFTSADFKQGRIKAVDLVMGEEKTTRSLADTSVTEFRIYTPEFMARIRKLTEEGVNILMSGSYVGSDLMQTGDSTAVRFASGILHFSHRTGHSVKTGGVYTTDKVKGILGSRFNFNTELTGAIYQAEAPDAIEPSDKESVTAFRYSENNASAGILYKGNTYRTVILGFPFETITGEDQRTGLMKQIMNFFEN